MIANASIDGLSLLTAMADSAAVQASAQIQGHIRLSHCTSFELAEGFGPGDVDLESWPVIANHDAVTISVFATSRDQNGARRMAGSGRFTFAILNPSTGRASASLHA